MNEPKQELTAREMQRRATLARLANTTPEERSAKMKAVAAKRGADAFREMQRRGTATKRARKLAKLGT